MERGVGPDRVQRPQLGLHLRVLHHRLLERVLGELFLLIAQFALPFEELSEADLPMDYLQAQLIVYFDLVRGVVEGHGQLVEHLLEFEQASVLYASLDSGLELCYFRLEVLIRSNAFVILPFFVDEFAVLVDDALVDKWLQLLARLHERHAQLVAHDAHFAVRRVELPRRLARE